MQSQLFSCSVCYTEFDNKEKKPKIIPGCGHTICLFCLEKILGMSKPMCPLDRKPLTRKVEDYSTNIIVLQLIEEKEQSQGGCALHNNEPSNLVCLDDKCVICKYCAEYGDHKGHKIKHVNDVQKEANTQRIRLKDMIDALEEEEQAIYKELDENKEGLLDEYKKRYVSLKEEVARREQKSFHAIQEFFALKRLMVSQKLKSQLMMKEKLQKKVQDLSNVNNCQAFFDAFKGEADEIAAATAGHIEEDQSVKEKALRMVEEFRSKFVTELEKLEENVTSLLKHDSEHEMDASLPHMDEEDVLKILKFSKKLGKLVVAPLKEDEKRSEVLKLPEECNKIILDFSKTSASDDALLAISWLFNKFGRKINDVKIDISDKSIPVSDLLELYSPLFYIISSAEIIELVLTSCDVSDKHLKEILNTKLSCVKTLKGIRLQLRGTKITDRGVEFISDFVRSRKDTIENFYLNASATQVSDSSIEKLCTSFSPHMKNFSLILNSAAGITDKTVELINQHILPLSENWKVLALHFFETKISDTSIIKLLASLREKVPTLTHFFFEVGKTKVTEKSLEFYITEILPRLQGLESFMLGAASLKLDGMIIQNLLEAFNCETFKNLEYFALSLDNVPFSDKHLEYFAKNILVDMKKVESLIFTLTGASLTDAGVEPFFIMMKEIAEKIKSLNLRLVKNVQVSDKSVELFDKQIFPLLVNLEALTFQVDRTQVSDHGRNLLSTMEKQVLDRDINMII